MYTKLTKLLVLALIVIMLLCGCSEAVPSSTTQSVDGIVAVVTTDKVTYTGTETAKVTLEIINNTGKSVSVSTELKAPDGLNVNANAASSSFLMEPGERISLSGMTVKMNPAGIILGIVLGLLAVAATSVGVFVVIHKKKAKKIISLVLCMMIIGSMILHVPTANAEEKDAYYESSMTVYHPVVVDGKEVPIQVLVNYEIGLPSEVEYEPLVEVTDWVDEDCNKPNGKTTAFFYNDYDGDYALMEKGATVIARDHIMELGGTEEQGYLRCEITDESTYPYYQADFKDNKIVENFVVHFKISTENELPTGTYMLYRYCEEKNASLFSFDANGMLKIGSEVYSEYKVTPNSWLEIDIVFDLTPESNDLCTFYANGQELVTRQLIKHEESYKIPYMRLCFVSSGNVGKTALVDDFMIYQGKEILGIDEVNSPRYPYWEKPKEGEDVAIDLPELSDLGENVIAVLAGSDQAYVNGQLITLSDSADNASSGDVFTDASVPADFLKNYMGIDGLDAGKKYSILRYSTGKNILVDSRGMIVLTEDVKLDPDVDFQVLTLLYGYLKTGILEDDYAIAPALTQDIIDQAVASTEIYIVTATSRHFDVMKHDLAMYYMVLAAHTNPTVTASDGTVVATEVADRIKRLLAGGNEPWASVGCYWEHGVVSSLITLAKNTPVIWEQMSEDDIKRADLLMECLAIAANWGYNADNDYQSGFELTGTFGKDYNPNFMTAYITCYFNACMYFGAEKVDEIFTNFDYNSYIQRLEEVGFDNIKHVWSTTDVVGVCIGEYMQNGGEIVLQGAKTHTLEQKPAGTLGGNGVGVAVAWRYEDLETGLIYDSGDFQELFCEVVEYTYGWEVMNSYQAPGSMYYAYTKTLVQSPWTGQMGMMREFGVGTDRSKVEYCYLSAVNIAPLYSNMKLLGYWDYDANPELAQRMLEMDNRIYVGTEDLFFKMDQGYIGCANQTQVEEEEYHFNQELGANYVKDIFMNFLFMKNEPTVMDTKEEIVTLASPAEPKDGITEAPEDAIEALGKSSLGTYITDFYAPFDGQGYKNGNVSFDIVIEDELVETNFNAVIAIDQKYPGKGYSDSPMLLAFDDGVVSIMNENQYLPVKLSFGANYRFHVDIQFDCTTGKYSGTITQTWPETAEPVSASFTDYNFRTTSKMSFVDSLMVCSGSGYKVLWVENVQVSGDSITAPGIDLEEDVIVDMDLSAVPSNVRPSQLKVNLVMNDWQSSRTVTFTAADRWSAKVFDGLPTTLSGYDVDWSVAIDDQIPGYYATVIQTGENQFKIVWSDTKHFYSNDFENWNKGEFVSGNTPIYDSYGNALQDWSDRATKGDVVQGGETNGNHYLKFNGDQPMQATMLVDDEIATGVYAIKMRIKSGTANATANYMNFSYRYTKEEKSVKSNVITLNKNVLSVGGYSLGSLSADVWTEFTVVLDFNTLIGEVFCGENAARMTFELEAPNGPQLIFWVAAGSDVCVDDLQVYTSVDLSVEKPTDEANKEQEIIVPDTPPAQLDPSYTWYYSADFEYWNKGAYEKSNTPIVDAYGNVMIDQWSDTMGPLVRSEEESGNHYLELSSLKPVQGGINVDTEHDDGVYIIKWRMKLKDANSTVTNAVFSYRYGDFVKHNFATIDSQKAIVCGVNLGKLTADAWLEVMVVLDFNELVGTVCDWEGHKLGSMELKDITSSMFNIYASAGMQGLCIDDLQLFSGNVTIIEPEAPPELDTNYEWYYSNDFESTAVVSGDGNKNIADLYGNIFADNGDAYQTVLDGENTVLAIQSTGNGQQALVWTNTGKTLPMSLTIKMKMKVEADASFAKDQVTFRYRRGDKNYVFGSMLNQKMWLNNAIGDATPDLTQWTDVELTLNSQTGACTYRIGEAEGTFTIAQSETGLQGFMIRIEIADVSGLYIDDLQVYTNAV